MASLLSAQHRENLKSKFRDPDKVEQDRQCTYKRKFERRSCNNCCLGKAMSITFSGCIFVALFIQRTKCVRRVVLSSLTCLIVSYFSTSFHKFHDFRKKTSSEHNIFVLIFSANLSQKCTIIKRIRLDIIINVLNP